jgi:hypothetical protein
LNGKEDKLMARKEAKANEVVVSTHIFIAIELPQKDFHII